MKGLCEGNKFTIYNLMERIVFCEAKVQGWICGKEVCEGVMAVVSTGFSNGGFDRLNHQIFSVAERSRSHRCTTCRSHQWQLIP